MLAIPPTLATVSIVPRPSVESTCVISRLYGKRREWTSPVWRMVRWVWHVAAVPQTLSVPVGSFSQPALPATRAAVARQSLAAPRIFGQRGSCAKVRHDGMRDIGP